MANDDTDTDLPSSMTGVRPFAARNKVTRLPPKTPSQDQEAEAMRIARDNGFVDSGTENATDTRAGDSEPRLRTLIPTARNNDVDTSLRAISRSDWREKYEQSLAEGKPLDRPVGSYNEIAKDRFTQVMPAYLWAALEALAAANGFKKEHELIEFMLEQQGAFSDK